MSRVLPILFNTDMVQAILDGRKTVTRRIVKPPYFIQGDENDKRTLIALRTAPKGSKLYREIGRMPYPDSPYNPGDTLYVRETWAWEPCWDCGMDTEEHNCCDKFAHKIFNHDKKAYGCYMYRASCEDNVYPSVDKWHPSIHMPKEAARIWLKVTDVRVERLRDITEEQAEKEGGIDNRGFVNSPENEYNNLHTAKEHFMQIWNSTIKKTDRDRYGWDASPWVWVIEFERCEKPENDRT